MKTSNSIAEIALVLFLSWIAAARLAGAEPPLPSFAESTIDGRIQIGYGLAIADVDGDKRPDILLADKNEVVWYENPSWSKHVIAERLTERDHVCIAARDIDGDGKAEIAVGAEWNPGDTENSGAVFYLVAPADRKTRWKPVRLPHEPTTHRMYWVRDWQEGFRLVVLPLHGRGNRNGEGAGVRILRYTMPEDPHQAWTTQLIDESLHKTHNLDPVQWDEDQADELLIAGAEGLFVSNWSDGAMVLRPIATETGGGAGETRLGHLPGGGRCVVSIEPMHGNQFVAYTPPKGDHPDGLWSRRVVDESLVDGHAIGAGDVLGVGSDQFVVGWRAMNRPGAKVGIKLFTPLDKEGQAWRETLIDDNTMACEDLKLADLNGDGRLDIIAAGRATKNVKIYLNRAKP